jgi:cell division protein FtsN
VKAEAQTLKVVNNSTLQGVGQTQAKTILEKIIVSAKVPVNIGTSSVNRSYSVQIGAFKEEVPLATANKFLKMSAKKIKNLKDNRDLTVYTVGNFSIRDEAVSLKNEMIAKGFQGAFIITFENGEIVK